MLEDLKKDAAQRMQKCVAAFKEQLKKMRTGRAHTSLIEHIKVDYYGSEMPLNQVANIATEDARTLTVSPWEKAMVPVIEKAIYKSDLGLTPNTAGQIIRIHMPALTEERRRDIIKVVKSEAENARVAVRGVRREVMSELKEMLKEKLIAQDDDRRAQDDEGELAGAGQGQRRVVGPVALDVAQQLRAPVPLVVARLGAVLGARVPEAAVDEDGHLARGERDVRPDPPAAVQVQPVVLAVAVAEVVQRAAQGQLGLGVRPPVGPHVGRPALAGGMRIVRHA